MRLIFYISCLNILLIGCSNPKRNLIVTANDYEIDLTQLDSVRENLNGFWIPEDDVDGQEILWLDFNNGENSTSWWEMPYTSEIKRTQTIPVKSCQTVIGLIKINGQVNIERVGLTFSDTTNIKYLSKNKFKIHGTTYLKHKGYDFLTSRRNKNVW
ncbi:hypothetical protein [uncultured Croceitalea sp.]|uniref:hypothetical protein n=1 Tax=uncultured Croceitalea sp. TaxID=1798908 RepID=UPI0033056518